jgi:hypothetical protein
LAAAETAAVEIRSERMRQARTSFNLAVVSVAAGAVLILLSLILVAADQTSAAVVSTAASTMTQAAALAMFRISRDANRRLDAVASDLSILERLRLALELSDEIADPAARDRVIAETVRALAPGSRDE